MPKEQPPTTKEQILKPLEEMGIIELKEEIARLEKETKEKRKNKSTKILRRNFLKQAALITLGTMTLSHEIGSGDKPFEKEKTKPTSEKKSSREEKIANTIEKCKQIILNEQYEKILENPYLVTALYYSEKTFKTIKLPSKHASEEILGNIYPLITKQFRENYMSFLKELAREPSGNVENIVLNKYSLPLDSINWKGAEANHEDAIDLFIKEGSLIYSMTNGIVVLSENDWNKDDDMSTSSMLGGNSIIIFNPQDESFYRYAHMEKTNIKVGSIVSSSEIIGIVGHTGRNASKNGHGEHVHIEINKYDKKRGVMVSSYIKELQKRIRSLRK